jgi:formaldehyde-activating enzyme
MIGMQRTIDGAIGEGWSGRDPDGCHVNVVLAQRGSVTAAALMTAFTTPRQGHSPILVCVGADKDHYEPIWPPTVMMNKATIAGERHAKITYGATQLGVGQGVLDAVADDLLPPTDATIVFVAVWIDPGAGDESAVRDAARKATRKAVGMAVSGRDEATARALVERRDDVRNPYYSGS